MGMHSGRALNGLASAPKSRNRGRREQSGGRATLITSDSQPASRRLVSSTLGRPARALKRAIALFGVVVVFVVAAVVAVVVIGAALLVDCDDEILPPIRSSPGRFQAASAAFQVQGAGKRRGEASWEGAAARAPARNESAACKLIRAKPDRRHQQRRPSGGGDGRLISSEPLVLISPASPVGRAGSLARSAGRPVWN